MPNWTEEQLQAIQAKGTRVLLSAAAGSGKTTVLVERVLRLLTEQGADIDRMLVVTFTRAAASDMRAKLTRQLSERAARGDVRCREQLLKLDRAAISTLHSFCADFLRVNFEAAGVDPAFRVLDESVAARLRDEALDEALEEAYTAQEETLLTLDQGRGPGGVRAAVQALMRRLEERPDPGAWLEKAVRCDENALAAWQQEIMRAAKRRLALALVQLNQALLTPGIPEGYDRAIRADVQILTDIAAIGEYDPLMREIEAFRPTRASSRRGEMRDEDALEAVKKLRSAAKDDVYDAANVMLPLIPGRSDAAALEPQLRALGRIALRAMALCDEKKAEQSGLTYADLEHRTLRALSNGDVAQAMRERFDYVFVDEYQDTSDLQEALVQAVSRSDNLFMVGDVKQSIYRFRLAEPRLFLEKYASYARNEGGTLLPLTRNFRSRPGILEFVNLIFERAMTGGDSEIVYDRLARLNPGRTEADGGECVSIRLIDTKPGEQEEIPSEAGPDALPEDDDTAGHDAAAEALAELKGAQREGLYIAGEIRRMMDEDPTLRYRDFVILSRSRSGVFDAMLPSLLVMGIPAYADGASGYYDSMEILWLMALLRLIANGRNDVDLIGVLHSPAVGLSADALARVRIAYRSMPYSDAVSAYAAEKEDPIAVRLAMFLKKLSLWRLRCQGMALGEFVRLLLDESGFYTYAGALPGGAQRQANLDQFVSQACRFDRDISGSLTRFLQYTEYMRARGDADAAHLMGENDDVMRLMTVHKSKGLEFRVVFGAMLARRYQSQRVDAPLFSHRELGLGMNYVDPILRTRRVTLGQQAIICRQKQEDAAEELRILYVMLTRAQEKLILVGTIKDYDTTLRHWQALAQAPFAGTSHLDVLMAARCAAEKEGLPLASECLVVPAGSIAPARPASRDSAALQLKAILDHLENWADASLEREMQWIYPDALSGKKPLKLTASGLLRELEGPDVIQPLAQRPLFMAETPGRLTGAERGTAYHRVMQLLSLKALSGLSGAALRREIVRQMDDMAARRLLTPVQKDTVEPARLQAFLESDTGMRLRSASQVRREWAFNVMLKIADALGEDEAGPFGGEELLVQGAIDCCFIEDGQWVLLDYKTDRTDDMNALREHYHKQLGVYALALERITGMRVKQRLLCLLHAGDVLEV